MAFRLLAADEKHVAARMSESTPQRLAEVTGFLAKSGLDEISGEFGQLQALAAFDRVEQAGVVLESIRESYSQWPRPWRDAAGQLERAIEVRDEAAVAALRFRSAFQLDSAPKEFMHVRSLVVPASGQPIEGLDAVPRGIWLHVSKRDYVLTVYRHDTPLRQFPVGLGQDESTPEGVFHIANRIPNPDWYDHGRTVKAGDPGNPLGSRWMGLGNTSGPTPYGIHPTNDSGSIGANRSRGCIRMRSADAERLFNLCTVGVPVIITGK